MKRTRVCGMRAALRQQSIACTDNMYVRQCKFFIILHIPTNDCESTVSINLGVINKFDWVANLQVKTYANNEDQPGQYSLSLIELYQTHCISCAAYKYSQLFNMFIILVLSVVC